MSDHSTHKPPHRSVWRVQRMQSFFTYHSNGVGTHSFPTWRPTLCCVIYVLLNMIAPLVPLVWSLETCLVLPNSSHWHIRTVRLGYTIQFAPVLCAEIVVWTDAPTEFLQLLLHRTEERQWVTTNPRSASSESGPAQDPVQDVDAKMHSDICSFMTRSCLDTDHFFSLPSSVRHISTRSYLLGCPYLLGARTPQPIRASYQLRKEQALTSAEHLFSWELDSVTDGTSHKQACPVDTELPEVIQGKNSGHTKTISEALGASSAAGTLLRLMHMRQLQHWLQT